MTDTNGNGKKFEIQFYKLITPTLLVILMGLLVYIWQDTVGVIHQLQIDVKANTKLLGGANTADQVIIGQVNENKAAITANKEGILECKQDIRDLRLRVGP